MEASQSSTEAPVCPGCAKRDRRIAALEARVSQLEQVIEQLRRGDKRQAVPFSKGPPKSEPKRPGRKPGDDYGPKAFRAVPPHIDEEHDAPLPKACPNCHAGNERFAAHLWKHFDELFAFLRHDDIDATNYRAEQAIRPAVVNRKVFGGNRTEAGAVAQSILMSVLGTAAKLGRDAMDFVSQTLRAVPGGQPRLHGSG